MCNLYSITTNQATGGKVALPLAESSSRGRRWKTELEARVRQSDPMAAAQRTAAKARPPVKYCIVCDAEFTRAYRDIHGKPRLRSPKEWATALVLQQGLLFDLSKPQAACWLPDAAVAP